MGVRDVGTCADRAVPTHEALSLLARLLHQAERLGWVGNALEIFVLQAVASRTGGGGVGAKGGAAGGPYIAGREGHLRPFWGEGGRGGGVVSQGEARR